MVLRYAALSGARILVGQSAAENDALCAAAEPHDLWFHLEGDSSPHVILQCAGEPCAQAIADCCQLCKSHSKSESDDDCHCDCDCEPCDCKNTFELAQDT